MAKRGSPFLKDLQEQLSWLREQRSELALSVHESIERLNTSAELLANPVYRPMWAGDAADEPPEESSRQRPN